MRAVWLATVLVCCEAAPATDPSGATPVVPRSTPMIAPSMKPRYR